MKKSDLLAKITTLEAIVANQQAQINELRQRTAVYGPVTSAPQPHPPYVSFPTQWPNPNFKPFEVTCGVEVTGGISQ